MSQSAFRQQLEHTYEYFTGLFDEKTASKWKPQHSSREVHLFKRKPLPNSNKDRANTTLYKSTTLIDRSPAEVLTVIKQQSLWDDSLLEVKNVAVVDDETTLFYRAFKSQPDYFSQERDFALAEYTNTCNPNYIDCMAFSVLTPLIPKKDNRNREKLVIGGWRIEKTDTGASRVTYILQANTGLSVPPKFARKFLLNRVSFCIRKISFVFSSGAEDVDLTTVSTPDALLTPPPSPIPTTVTSLTSNANNTSTVDRNYEYSAYSETLEYNNHGKTDTKEFVTPESSEVNVASSSSNLNGKNTENEVVDAMEQDQKSFSDYFSKTQVYKPHDYESEKRQAKDYLTELLPLDEWTLVNETKGVNIYTGKRDVQGMLVRGDSTWQIEGKGDPVENFLCVVTSREARQTWDPRFENSETVEWINPMERLIHSYQKGQFPVSGRDLFILQSQYYDETDNSTYVVQTSVPHVNGHGPTSSHVRAKLTLAAWKLTPNDRVDPTKLSVTYIVQINPNGSIPGRLVKMVSTQTPMCVGGVKDFIDSYGFPMRPHFVGNSNENIQSAFVKEKTSGTTFECTFKLTIKGGGETKSPIDGLVQFNICPKLYPSGAEVTCDDNDVVDIVVTPDLEFIRFYPKGVDNGTLTSSMEKTIKVKVTKRVASSRRNSDSVFYLNGGLMPFDERFKNKVATMGDDSNDATQKKLDSTPIVKQTTVEVVENSTLKTGIESVVRRRRSSTSITTTTRAGNNSTQTSFVYKEKLQTVGHSKTHKVEKKQKSTHSTISLVESLIVLFWILFLVVVPIVPQFATSLFSYEALEVGLTSLMVTKFFAVVNDSPIRHASSAKLFLCGVWVFGVSFVFFSTVVPDYHSLQVIGLVLLNSIIYLVYKGKEDVNAFENSGKYDGVAVGLLAVTTGVVFWTGIMVVDGTLDIVDVFNTFLTN